MSKNRTDYICKQLGIKLRKYDPSPNKMAALRYSIVPYMKDSKIKTMSKSVLGL